MLSTKDSLIVIGIIVIGTFLTRVLPFLLFPAHKETPKFVKYLGQVLPYSIIGMLIVYCLKGVTLTTKPYGLPEFIAILFIAFIHNLKRNTLLSVGGATVLYMILLQIMV
ncbi:MAG: branched-chain amino acid transporter AzlD [Clostridiales bacterium]|nr:branched-chain amino acid transporter AzlD [Clostridiales bacterium]